jgi:hypothetical protein
LLAGPAREVLNSTYMFSAAPSLGDPLGISCRGSLALLLLLRR